MVNVVRAFFQCLSTDCETVIKTLRERFKVTKVYSSKVVPNFLFVELDGEIKEVEDALSELGVEDFKVVRVVV